MTGAKS